jgi:predicted nicotinamide N-methyase
VQDDEMRALEQTLARRFRVVETTVSVAGRTLSLLHPASAEDLIDERDFERDERLPYWAELWPSARVLSGEVSRLDGKGRRLIELGCGMGLVAICAALAGFEVTVTDYYEDATRFARLNVWRNARRAVESRVVDWRAMPADLGRYDVAAASDVLYERPYGDLVAGAVAAVLDDDGVALVADPGRVGREPFIRGLAAMGLRKRSQDDVPYVDGAIHQTVSIFRIGRESRSP